MHRIKILFIHHGSGWGGAPISMMNTINKLDKSQFEPHVLLLKDSIVKDRLVENDIAYTVCDSFFYKKWYTYLTHSDAGYTESYKFYKHFKMFSSWFLSKYIFAPRVLKRHVFDIVHLNSSVLSDWVHPANNKGKVIYHIREPLSKGMFGFRYNFIRSEVEKYADKIIAISKDYAERINLPLKTEVVYNFIDIPHEIQETNLAKSILYAGGGAKIKGIEVLIDAIPFINKDIQVNLVGSFPKLKAMGILKKLAYKLRYPSAYKLQSDLIEISKFENVNILGALPTITKILQESTLLISPFTVPHFSRPIIEAFAYGKPVIASDVVGMNEIVDNNINGLITKNGDALALAGAINNLANNPKLIKKMRINGRNKAIELYSPERNVLKIETIYKELITKI
jgi:glycosyltransferase involved in cell wall biosynthesis